MNISLTLLYLLLLCTSAGKLSERVILFNLVLRKLREPTKLNRKWVQATKSWDVETGQFPRSTWIRSSQWRVKILFEVNSQSSHTHNQIQIKKKKQPQNTVLYFVICTLLPSIKTNYQNVIISLNTLLYQNNVQEIF